MKPSFVWDGQVIGPKRLRMPQVLGMVFVNILSATGLLTGAVGALGFTGVGALALGVGYAVTIGGAYLLQGLLQKTPPSAKPADVQTNIRQDVSPRRRIYGRYLTGSTIVFGFRRGEKSYILHYICEGPIAGYVGFRLDKKPITLDEDGFVTDEQYQVGGRSRVQILTTLGTMADEPFAELLAAFPELDTPLTPFRHRGCAMALQIVEQVSLSKMQDVYPNNLPSLQFLIDAYAGVYDPRTETTGLSDNAGCCLLSEIMDVYGLSPSDVDEIDLTSFSIFSDHSDEAIPLKAGGTEPRYRCAGPLMMDTENEARIQSIASVCNADVYMDARGRIAVRQKMRSTPGIALRAKNGDHLSLQLEGGRGLQKQFNVGKVTYVDPALNYKANEVRWQDDDLLEEDGTEYPQPASMLLCPSPTQGMRLAKLMVYEGNPEFTGSLISGPQALDLMEDYVFTLDLSPENDFERVACASGVIEFDGLASSVSTPIMIFREGANDWDPETDEQDQVIVPPELPSYVDEVTLDVTVTVGILNNSAPVLNFSWTALGAGTIPDSYSHQVEVSAAGDDEWLPANVNQESNTATFGPVADGGAYDWRIRNIASGKTFDWQYSTSPVTIVVDPVAPLALDSFTQTAAAPHLGNAVFSFRTKNDPRVRTVDIYRVPTGVAFNPVGLTPVISQSVVASTTYTGLVDGDDTRVNLVTNGDFATDTVWTKGTGWTISGGKGNKAAGASTSLDQVISLAAGSVYRTSYVVVFTAGTSFRIRLLNGAVNQNGTLRTASGSYRESLTALSGNTAVSLFTSSSFAGTVDDVVVYLETPTCVPPGDWDHYAVPRNQSGVAGPFSGPVTVTVV